MMTLFGTHFPVLYLLSCRSRTRGHCSARHQGTQHIIKLMDRLIDTAEDTGHDGLLGNDCAYSSDWFMHQKTMADICLAAHVRPLSTRWHSPMRGAAHDRRRR